MITGRLEESGYEKYAREKAENEALRDRFAMAALTGLLAATDNSYKPRQAAAVVYAYDIAELMLIERRKQR